ncbi:hypothetical protein J6590_105306 [Homalodisca vitripennis]|nr:hypothetical protein J6590_105306 [Homalodisca vitripennis]
MTVPVTVGCTAGRVLWRAVRGCGAQGRPVKLKATPRSCQTYPNDQPFSCHNPATATGERKGTEPRVARPSCLRNPISLYTQVITVAVMFAIYCRSLQVRLDLGYHSSASEIDRDRAARGPAELFAKLDTSVHSGHYSRSYVCYLLSLSASTVDLGYHSSASEIDRDRAARGPAELFAAITAGLIDREARVAGIVWKRYLCHSVLFMFAIYCRSLQVRLDLGYHSSASEIDRDSRAWPGRVVCETRYSVHSVITVAVMFAIYCRSLQVRVDLGYQWLLRDSRAWPGRVVCETILCTLSRWPGRVVGNRYLYQSLQSQLCLLFTVALCKYG